MGTISLFLKGKRYSNSHGGKVRMSQELTWGLPASQIWNESSIKTVNYNTLNEKIDASTPT